MTTRAWLRVGVLGLAFWLGGCCHREHRRVDRRCGPGAGLLFDPAGDSALAINDRADWPGTVAYDHPFEDIAYREVIMDQQGRFGFEDDRPYRRFESVRQGRVRR